MANVQTLHVYHAAVRQIRDIAQVTDSVHFGDLANQLRRAAVSVASNLAEGAGRGGNREFIRFVCIARASNTEIGAQLDILAALGTSSGELKTLNASIGRQLSGLIRHLRDSGG